MSDDLKQIGLRLAGLREVLDIPPQEMARVCETTLEGYLAMERGERDPGVSCLSRVARRYGVSLDVLLFGEEPKMDGYFVTRAGHGPKAERNSRYGYEALASGFKGRVADPFLTVIEPLADGERREPRSHEGQEFDYILEGELEIEVDGRRTVLHPGDSIYFEATLPHCMHATGDKPCRMLLVVM